MNARDLASSRADTCDDSTAGDLNASIASDDDPDTNHEDTRANVVPTFGDEDTNVDLYPDDGPITVTIDAAALASLAHELVGVGEQLALARRELDLARSRVATLEQRLARLKPM